MKTSQTSKSKLVYETPAIIYEGKLTARAGSLAPDHGSATGNNSGGVDTGIVEPGDLFGNNG